MDSCSSRFVCDYMPTLELPPEVPAWAVNYAKKVIAKYKIDKSHDLGHLTNVAAYAKRILERIPTNVQLHPDLDRSTAVFLIILAAFVHDLIDKKYMDEDAGFVELELEMGRNGILPDHILIIEIIVKRMSYSKRVARRKKGLPDFDGECKTMTEIVSDADLLDGYDWTRCLAYQERVRNDETKFARCKWVMVERVLGYIGDTQTPGFFSTDVAREMARPYHAALKCVMESGFFGGIVAKL